MAKDSQGHVFGAFLTEEWRNTRDFYGDGFSFVFTFHSGDDLEIYPASGETDFFIQSDHDSIIIGAPDVPDQRASLMISNGFSRGHSGVSNCYMNQSLCSSPLPGSTVQKGDFTLD